MAASDRFAEIAENFAALDFTPENIEIEALTAESTRLRAGIDKAEARCTIIASLKNEYRNAGREVADALLGEGSAIEAANLSPGPEALESERVTLRSAITNLRTRDRELDDQRRAIEAECRSRISQAALPLVAALAADLAAAGERVLAAWAALEAVTVSASNGTIEAAKANAATQGLMGDFSVFDWRKSVPVPADVAKCLSALAGKGLAAPFRHIDAAHPHPTVSPLIALAGRAA